MKKILFPLLFTFYLNVNSQVFTAGTIFPAYNDINPDTLLNYTVYPYTDENFFFNLFGDASDDLRLTAHGAVSSGGTSAYISVFSLNKNVSIRLGRLDSVFVPAYNFWNVTKVALPLSAGDEINNPAAVWDTTLLYLTDHTGWGGGVKDVNDWVGTDKYMGIKYQNGTTVSYGWIRVQCVSQDSCYIKDYSYSAPAALAVEEIKVADPQIFPNPVNDVFYIRNIKAEMLDITAVKLTDIYGKEINFTCEMKNNRITFNLDAAVPGGCYLLRCFMKDRVITRNFMKLTE